MPTSQQIADEELAAFQRARAVSGMQPIRREAVEAVEARSALRAGYDKENAARAALAAIERGAKERSAPYVATLLTAAAAKPLATLASLAAKPIAPIALVGSQQEPSAAKVGREALEAVAAACEARGTNTSSSAANRLRSALIMMQGDDFELLRRLLKG